LVFVGAPAQLEKKTRGITVSISILTTTTTTRDDDITTM